MKKILIAATIAALAVAPAYAKSKQRAPALSGELILYQMTDYNGDFYTIDSERTSVQTEWNIRSVSIHDGEKWQICAKPRFRDCIEINQSLPDASAVGINGQIGSARQITTG
jgi:hypothetical protein